MAGPDGGSGRARDHPSFVCAGVTRTAEGALYSILFHCFISFHSAGGTRTAEGALDPHLPNLATFLIWQLTGMPSTVYAWTY